MPSPSSSCSSCRLRFHQPLEPKLMRPRVACTMTGDVSGLHAGGSVGAAHASCRHRRAIQSTLLGAIFGRFGRKWHEAGDKRERNRTGSRHGSADTTRHVQRIRYGASASDSNAETCPAYFTARAFHRKSLTFQNKSAETWQLPSSRTQTRAPRACHCAAGSALAAHMLRNAAIWNGTRVD